MTAANPTVAAPIGRQVLAQLDRRGIRVLRIPDDLDIVNSVTHDPARSSAAIRRLAAAGELRRVRRGAYVVRSRAGTVDVGALELVGELSPIGHMVTAGRALSIHGLTDQAYRRTIVLVSTPMRDWAWLGESIQYAVVKDSDIWGWRPSHHARRPTHVAAPERAILDSISQPLWGVSLSVTTRALRAALGRAGFSARLAKAAARYGNAATARRVGYLVEHLAGPDSAAPFLSLLGTSHSVTPLRTGATKQGGDVDTRWMVRVNADLALLLESDG